MYKAPQQSIARRAASTILWKTLVKSCHSLFKTLLCLCSESLNSWSTPAHLSPLCPYLLPHSLCSNVLASLLVLEYIELVACVLCLLFTEPELLLPDDPMAPPSFHSSLSRSPRWAFPDSPLFNLQPHLHQATQKSLTPFLLYLTP